MSLSGLRLQYCRYHMTTMNATESNRRRVRPLSLKCPSEIIVLPHCIGHLLQFCAIPGKKIILQKDD